jgi:uncharacterized protein (DUF486 family)
MPRSSLSEGATAEKQETENLQSHSAPAASNCKSAKGWLEGRQRGMKTGRSMRITMTTLPVPLVTIGLLLASNIFMTFAWYGHLKYKETALITVILVSWGIAFFEYMLMVPANRIGHGHFSAAELKTIQEVITLSVFAVFSVYYLKEPLMWNHLVGFAFIAAGAFFIFHKWA